jgi:hypothetical protein
MSAVMARTGSTGGCQCGAVRYRLDSEPTGANICHCRMCQKASGSPFMAFTGVPIKQLVWTRGAPRTFASSAIVERGFCAECGTPLTYRMLERDRISVTIGSLDKPAAVAPEVQFGIESKLPWVDGALALPTRMISDWLKIDAAALASRQHPDREI